MWFDSAPGHQELKQLPLSSCFRFILPTQLQTLPKLAHASWFFPNYAHVVWPHRVGNCLVVLNDKLQNA